MCTATGWQERKKERKKIWLFTITSAWKKYHSAVLQCSDGLSNKVSNIIRRLMDNMECSSVVLQCSDGLSNKVSNIIRSLMDNMKLLLICILRVLLSHSLIFFRLYFFINVYMVLFLFNNVIYVFLLLWLCILIVCLCMSTLTEVFPCFLLSCKANARVKPAKTGHGPHSS